MTLHISNAYFGDTKPTEGERHSADESTRLQYAAPFLGDPGPHRKVRVLLASPQGKGDPIVLTAVRYVRT